MAVSLIVTLSPKHLLLIKLVVGKDQSYGQAGGGIHEREERERFMKCFVRVVSMMYIQYIRLVNRCQVISCSSHNIFEYKIK